MIHLIDAKNKHLYQAELDQHFRLRYDIYVRQRRWMALDRPDKREIDQFDTDEASYLLALQDGDVIGGTRLVPTLAPHLLSEVFPRFADVRGVPRRADIHEWTRIFVVEKHRGTGGSILHSLMAAVQIYGIEKKLSAVTALVETWWLPRFLELGWTVTPLGMPGPVDEMSVVAVSIGISEEAVRATVDFKQIARPVLQRRDIAALDDAAA